MQDIKMNECYRKNLCVDCVDKTCLHSGKIMADCPQWRCDNNYDCEHCDFIKEWQDSERRKYENEAK